MTHDESIRSLLEEVASTIEAADLDARDVMTRAKARRRHHRYVAGATGAIAILIGAALWPRPASRSAVLASGVPSTSSTSPGASSSARPDLTVEAAVDSSSPLRVQALPVEDPSSEASPGSIASQVIRFTTTGDEVSIVGQGIFGTNDSTGGRAPSLALAGPGCAWNGQLRFVCSTIGRAPVVIAGSQFFDLHLDVIANAQDLSELTPGTYEVQLQIWYVTSNQPTAPQAAKVLLTYEVH